MFLIANIFNKVYSFLLNFFAISGGIIALFQWNNTIKIKRAEYVNTLFKELNNNEKIKHTIYMFYYDESSWYNKDFHGSDFELDVDDTLNYFSYICYLRESNLISRKEFDFFKYSIDKSLHSFQVEEYLYNVYFHCKLNNIDLYFKNLYNYIRNNKIYDSTFFNDPKATRYKVFLDWRNEIK